MNKPFFTVFTPVYNRRHSLHRVWDSLCAQTDRDFEWIVVDDGSTDGVGELLAEYQAKAAFPMTVLSQPNQGKHFSWNRAVDLAKGYLFVPADSDDEFIPETLERFRALWFAIPAVCRDHYSGINVHCRDQYGEFVGDPYPHDVMTSDNLELYYRFKIQGEKWGCLRTDLLRLRKFPEIRGRGCFPLSWCFFWLAQRYRALCVNEVLRVYYRNLDDSITKCHKKKRVDAAEVVYLAIGWNLDSNFDYIWKHVSLAQMIRSFVGWWRVGFLTKRDTIEMMADLKGVHPRMMAWCTLPMGVIFYWLTYGKQANES
jgi:glycosyltransferase involved in cell wall biosynthesis